MKPHFKLMCKLSVCVCLTFLCKMCFKIKGLFIYVLFQVHALVVRTGADTANGQLVRSILYPKNYGFHLYADSIKFLFLMFAIAVIGTGLSIYLYILHGVSYFLGIRNVLIVHNDLKIVLTTFPKCWDLKSSPKHTQRIDIKPC